MLVLAPSVEAYQGHCCSRLMFSKSGFRCVFATNFCLIIYDDCFYVCIVRDTLDILWNVSQVLFIQLTAPLYIWWIVAFWNYQERYLKLRTYWWVYAKWCMASVLISLLVGLVTVKNMMEVTFDCLSYSALVLNTTINHNKYLDLIYLFLFFHFLFYYYFLFIFPLGLIG